MVRKLWKGKIVCFEVTFEGVKEPSDGETLMAVGIWFRFGEQQRGKDDVQGCDSCARLAGLVLSFIACCILLVIAP